MSFTAEVDRTRAAGTVEDIETDGEGKVLSVLTDADGEVPLRARLDAIVSAAEGAATPGEVQSLLSGLADAHATLSEQHERLRGEHSDVLAKLGQVLNAVGQIPTKPAGGARGWQYTDWLEAPTLAVLTQDTAETQMGRLIFPPLITQATLQFTFDVWSDDGGANERGELLVAPHAESLHFDIFPRDSDARFSVPQEAGKQYFNPAVVRAGSAGVFESQGVPMFYPLTGAIGAGESNENTFNGKNVLVTLGARKARDNSRQWEVRNAQIRLAYQQ